MCLQKKFLFGDKKMAEKQSAKKSKKMFKEVEKFILNERNNKN